MATNIITYFPDDVPTLTSRIESVEASTDKAAVRVSITRDPDGDIDTFFSTTIYAFDGKVSLYEVGKLIEESFRKADRIYDIVEIDIDGVTVQFLALYCEWILDLDFDHLACFFSAAPVSIVHPSSSIHLAHWPKGSDSYTVKTVGLDFNGSPKAVITEISNPSHSQWATFSVDQIINLALADEVAKLQNVAFFAINYGQIQKIYYLAHDPEFLTFRFRNIFNAPEYIDIVGTVKRKTIAEHSTAVCNGRAIQYGRAVSRTYEVQTAALTEDQAREIEQLVASHKVQLRSDSELLDVLITDHTFEVDNDDSSLMSVKFYFRFANSRPTVRDAEMGHLLPNASHIFSDEYSTEFS